MLKALWNKFAMPCSQATFLASKKLDGSITFFERIRLSAHFLSCHVCAVYERQIKAIQDLLKTLGGDTQVDPKDIHLTTEQRERIKSSLNKEMNT